ncbi:hypothetical protein, partial [Leptolyngbya sp. FACHB-711]
MPRSSPTVDSAADPPAVSLSPEQSGDRGNSFGLALASIDFLPRFLRLATINVLSNLMVPLSGLISVA